MLLKTLYITFAESTLGPNKLVIWLVAGLLSDSLNEQIRTRTLTLLEFKKNLLYVHITANCARQKNKKIFLFFSKFRPYFWKKIISLQNNIARAAHQLNKPG